MTAHFSYVIEHMEEDDESSKTLPEWVELEYSHMRTLAGPSSSVHFTHLSKNASSALESCFAQHQENSLAAGKTHQIGVLDLMKQYNVALERVCLLDPRAEREISPEDGDGRFEWFLFGGILGDDPPRDRTSELRVLGFPSRRLGPVQMTTDTALGVTKLVVHDKIALEEIPYVDQPTITLNATESVEMPFRYIVEQGEPKLPPGMREHLLKDLDQGFDFS